MTGGRGESKPSSVRGGPEFVRAATETPLHHPGTF
jgi:hypothetical protein